MRPTPGAGRVPSRLEEQTVTGLTLSDRAATILGGEGERVLFEIPADFVPRSVRTVLPVESRIVRVTSPVGAALSQ